MSGLQPRDSLESIRCRKCGKMLATALRGANAWCHTCRIWNPGDSHA